MTDYLVTGVAGFIGYHVARRLLEQGHAVAGLDNLNDYYEVRLKEARLAELQRFSRFDFTRQDIADRELTARFFVERLPQVVIHLAAQAGVRYSLTHPQAYIDSNLVGFANILEGCRRQSVKHLVYASSSSVYGANATLPFSEHASADHPVSLYGATKRANELMAHAYAMTFGLPCTGLRFFTVYGPWGRPDMALFLFTRSILEGRPIPVFNHGQLQRDFTYIDDIVEGIVRVALSPPNSNPAWNAADPDPASSSAPYRVFNIGNHQPVPLLRFIEVLERALGKPALKEMRPMQPGDVLATFADVSDLATLTGFQPATPLEVGVARFVEWYRQFYGV